MRTLLLLVALAAVAASQITTELTYRISLRRQLIEEGRWAEYAAIKEARRVYAKHTVLAGITQNVNDFDDSEYVGNITIGTPEQTFQVILDTGSANLWVPDKTCATTPAEACDRACDDIAHCIAACDLACCSNEAQKMRVLSAVHHKNNEYFGLEPKNDVCKSKHQFDSTKSTTYKKDGKHWKITYGTGSASGFQGQDTVALGNHGTKQLVVPHVTFGQATTVAQFFRKEPIDGILGLAFQSLSVNSVKPVFQEAIDQKLVEEPLFTVWLEHEGLVENRRGGAYTWGGIDTKNCGKLVGYQPLSSATYYQFEIKHVSLGSFLSNTKYEVISDTGTSLIAAPEDIAHKIGEAAGGKYNAQYGLYTIDCKATVKDLIITVGAHELKLTSKNIVVPLTKTECAVAVQGFKSGGFGPSWILGDPFVRQYCNIYDMGHKRIGFAPSLQK